MVIETLFSVIALVMFTLLSLAVYECGAPIDPYEPFRRKYYYTHKRRSENFTNKSKSESESESESENERKRFFPCSYPPYKASLCKGEVRTGMDGNYYVSEECNHKWRWIRKSSKVKKSPAEPSSDFDVGTVKDGLDGNLWKVVMNGQGVRRWIRYLTEKERTRERAKREKAQAKAKKAEEARKAEAEKAKAKAEKARRKKAEKTRRANDPYYVLGVKKSASYEEIKKRWSYLVKKYHPDKYSGSSRLFREIHEAFQRIKRIKPDCT